MDRVNGWQRLYSGLVSLTGRAAEILHFQRRRCLVEAPSVPPHNPHRPEDVL